ncbi:MAG: hypothetical protein AAFY59_10575 [Pseudomonadota bacterium]
MKPLVARVKLDQPVAVTQQRVRAFDHWENLAKSKGFEVVRHPHTPPLELGQSWDLTGIAGRLQIALRLVLRPTSAGRDIGLTTDAFGIAATLDLAVTGLGGQSDVTVEIALKPTTLQARALLAPIKLKRTEFERKLAKLVARHLTVSAL